MRARAWLGLAALVLAACDAPEPRVEAPSVEGVGVRVTFRGEPVARVRLTTVDCPPRELRTGDARVVGLSEPRQGVKVGIGCLGHKDYERVIPGDAAGGPAEIALPVGAPITGRVVDAWGKGVRAHLEDKTLDADTDEDGNFALYGCEPGEFHELCVDTRAPWCASRLLRVTAPATEVVVPLEAQGSVSIRVSSREFSPAAFGELNEKRLSYRDRLLRKVEGAPSVPVRDDCRSSVQEGALVVSYPHLVAGDYRFLVRWPGVGAAAVDFEVGGRELARVSVGLVRSRTLIGHVFGSAEVFVGVLTDPSDEYGWVPTLPDGSFVLTDVPPGEGELLVVVGKPGPRYISLGMKSWSVRESYTFPLSATACELRDIDLQDFRELK